MFLVGLSAFALLPFAENLWLFFCIIQIYYVFINFACFEINSIILSFSTLIDAYVISFVTSSKESALKLMKKPRNYKVLINSYIVRCLST